MPVGGLNTAAAASAVTVTGASVSVTPVVAGSVNADASVNASANAKASARAATVAANIQQQTDLLAQATALHGRFAFANHDDGRHGNPKRLGYELSPIGGKCNPISPPFKTWVEGDVAHGRTTLGWQYEGPPNTVHGGFVCALFDQFLGVAQYMTGNYGFTGTLSVRFKRPTPLCTELQLIGRIKEVSGRKISVVGEIWANGVMTASCECLFIQVDWGQLEKLHAGG